jgi:hypothetical protein
MLRTDASCAKGKRANINVQDANRKHAHCSAVRSIKRVLKSPIKIVYECSGKRDGASFVKMD